MMFFTQKRPFKKAFSFFLKPFIFLAFFTQFYLFAAAQIPVRPKLAVQLLLNTDPGPQNTADGVVAFFDDRFSFSIGNEDSYKWTNLDENLAIVRNGKLLSIEGRPTLHGCDTMNLRMWTFRQKTYYLKLNGSNFSRTAKAVVRDNYLDKESLIDLSSSNLVPFSLTTDSASFAPDRFSVVFKTARVSTLSGAMKFSSVFKENSSFTVAPNPVTGSVITLHLNNMKQGKYEVSLYSADGQMVYSGYLDYDGIAVSHNILLDRRMHTGTYSLLISNGDQAVTRNILFE